METAAIQTIGLTRRFGALTAVDNVSFSVAPGQFFGFLGPNGAGKSTTIKMLTGLLEPSLGSIAILGQPFSASALEGVKVAVEPAKVTAPATGVVPGPVKVKVVVLMVAGFMAWLKVAVTTVLGQTPAAPFAGVSETTVGGTQAAEAVVKVHT